MALNVSSDVSELCIRAEEVTMQVTTFALNDSVLHFAFMGSFLNDSGYQGNMIYLSLIFILK